MVTRKRQGICNKIGNKWPDVSSPASENATCFREFIPHWHSEENPQLLYVVVPTTHYSTIGVMYIFFDCRNIFMCESCWEIASNSNYNLES